MEALKRHECPVCGFPDLTEPPRSRSGGGSYEICPSCGFQFGVSDDDAGLSHAAWREQWRAGGMRWSSRGRIPPRDWDPAAQLARVTLAPAAKSKRSGPRRRP